MAPRERQLVRPYWDAFWHFNYYDYRDSDAEWYYLDSQRYGHAHHPVGGLALKGQTKSPHSPSLCRCGHSRWWLLGLSPGFRP
jgi:hypothetical protein